MYAVTFWAMLWVRDHIPLEQGLRLRLQGMTSGHVLNVRDHIPLEQGLRLYKTIIRRIEMFVRDHIPLEQGLRRTGPNDQIILNVSETIFH